MRWASKAEKEKGGGFVGNCTSRQNKRFITHQFIRLRDWKTRASALHACYAQITNRRRPFDFTIVGIEASWKPLTPIPRRLLKFVKFVSLNSQAYNVEPYMK
ncbi:hypothetical protein E3N88_36262 [Mikania micrantha]|uniref:Uncharacterized protein n=1 Tax=Mikania micrantha TaxID=192012 RepID=A0A5N6M3M6_9ASTR|nr:hypothetical protein E3N88_36262 [Mikania micrantha]